MNSAVYSAEAVNTVSSFGGSLRGQLSFRIYSKSSACSHKDVESDKETDSKWSLRETKDSPG